MKTEYLTLTAWARKIGVSRQRANEWLLAKRITAYRPCRGVVLIASETARPKPMTPWQKTHEEDLYLQ